MSDDIVCSCTSVSAADIRKAIEAGALTFQGIQNITGLSSLCGVCIDDVEMIVAQLLTES